MRTAILAGGLLLLAACSREGEGQPVADKAGPNNVPTVTNDPAFMGGAQPAATEALVDVKCRRGSQVVTLVFTNIKSQQVGNFPATVTSGGSTSTFPATIEASPVGAGAKVTAEAPLNDPTVAAFVRTGSMDVSLPTGFKSPMRAPPEARDGMNRLLAYCRGDIPTPDPTAPAFKAPPAP